MRRASRRRVQIAVAGGGSCSKATARLAETVGREIARAGAVLVCGGLGGVMAAAARGAAEAGGLVVGILPGYAHAAANPYCAIALPTGLGHARNALVAAGGDALVALPGRDGTLAEIALASVVGCPVVAVGAWPTIRGVVHARSPREAVARALTAARRRRGAPVRAGAATGSASRRA
jgi:uncharacterized protein (TIGR00725 family)